MQQVVIKGRTYLSAYYVAKEFGYAPAYLRDLYDTNEVVGVFWKNSLYLDAVSWQTYVDTHSQAVSTGQIHTTLEKTSDKKATDTKAVTAVDEHHYLHHAKPRRSRYERDPHDLMPQPKKLRVASDETAPTIGTVTEAAGDDQAVRTPSRPTKLKVNLADAEPVRVQTIGPTSTVYTATERPKIQYQGSIPISVIYEDDEVEVDAEMSTIAEPEMETETEAETAPEADTADRAPETEAPAKKAPTVAASPQKKAPAKDDATTATATSSRRRFRLPALGLPVVAVLVLLAVASLASVLFVEQYVVAGENGIETSWRLSMQAATLWLAW